MMENLGDSRLAALRAAIDIVRRGGTVSLSGVYGGAADPLPMLQCSTSRSSCDRVRRTSSAGSTRSCRCSPMTTRSASRAFATHHLPLTDAPDAYENFQKKEHGMIKVVFNP